MNIQYDIGESFLGWVLVAQSEHGICAITLGHEPQMLLTELQTQFPHATLTTGDKTFSFILAQIIAFIEQPQSGFHWPLDIRGTAFQQQVWQALQTINPGETLSYRQLAERIGAGAAGRFRTADLTRRQHEILRLVAQGQTNAEIAHALVLSPRTVEMHVANILATLDSRSRAEAVRRATELGLLESVS